jgi:signal peptidase II
VSVVAVALDQLTKWWAETALSEGRSVAVLPTVELDLVYNSGFSFSAGAGSGRLVGIGVIVVCAAIVGLIARAATVTRLVLLSVILGGALGNLMDRIFRAEDGFLSGEVVDFIDVSWYAVFNVADCFVVVGAVALVLSELTAGRRGSADAGREDATVAVGEPAPPESPPGGA